MSAARYHYKGMGPHGRPVRGSLVADSRGDVDRFLQLEGITRATIGVRSARLGASAGGAAVTRADVAAITRELCALVQARVPLNQGLMVMAQQETRPHHRALLESIAQRLASGQPLARAVEPHRELFGEVYLATLRAAEASGDVIGVMGHLADMLESEIEMRQQWRRAMTYPLVVLVVVAIACVVLLVFVIPRFGATFQQQGVRLPLVTRALIGLGEFSSSHWWWVLSLLLLAGFGLRAWLKTRRARVAVEHAAMKLPYFGRVLAATTTARFSRVLAIAFGAGLSAMESVRMAAHATGRPGFIDECATIEARIRAGEELDTAIVQTRYLPTFAKRMIGSGRDSGEVSRACTIVSRHFDRESGHLLKNVSSMIEPILTVVLAGVVLTIALSVFLPMWQMVRVHR